MPLLAGWRDIPSKHIDAGWGVLFWQSHSVFLGAAVTVCVQVLDGHRQHSHTSCGDKPDEDHTQARPEAPLL